MKVGCETVVGGETEWWSCVGSWLELWVYKRVGVMGVEIGGGGW
jgi:hypothetical protein